MLQRGFKLNDKNYYIITDNNEVVDVTTGEVISINEVRKAKEKKLLKDIDNINKELWQLGYNGSYIIKNNKMVYENCIEIKKNYHFNKKLMEKYLI